MSVSLLVEYNDPQKEDLLVPIAAEEVFEKYWQPATARLGLQFVPLFQSGLPIKKNDIPLIISELTRLRRDIASRISSTLPQEMREHIVKRIDTLLVELKLLQEDARAEGYIS